MSKRLILILALAFVVGIAFAAYAETQNIKVSGDLEFMSVYRNSFTFKGKDHPSTMTEGAGTSDNIFLSIARIRTDADLTDNVSATIRLISEWIWGKEDASPFSPDDSDSNTNVDIDLAYVTLKEFLYSPLTLIVGRQELHYGNDMIIGDVSTNKSDYRGSIPGDLSKRKAFDAVRAIFNYDPLTVDLVYSKIRTNRWVYRNDSGERIGNRRDDDTDLYGVNAKYDLDKKTAVEGYYWYRRIGPRAYGYYYGGGSFKSDQLHTFGGRVSTEPLENLIFQLEGALQAGRANLDAGTAGRHVVDRKAWALETALTYNFKKVKYTPSVTLLYAYFSGDNGPAWNSGVSGRYRGWDPMFENQSFGRIANVLMPQSNVRLIGLTGSMKPKDDTTLKLEYYNYWAVDDYPTNSPGSGTSFATDYIGYGLRTKGDNRHLGHEIDLTAIYDYTEDVQLSLMTDIMIPGGAFANETSRKASEVIGSMKVTF